MSPWCIRVISKPLEIRVGGDPRRYASAPAMQAPPDRPESFRARKIQFVRKKKPRTCEPETEEGVQETRLNFDHEPGTRVDRGLRNSQADCLEEREYVAETDQIGLDLRNSTQTSAAVSTFRTRKTPAPGKAGCATPRNTQNYRETLRSFRRCQRGFPASRGRHRARERRAWASRYSPGPHRSPRHPAPCRA